MKIINIILIFLTILYFSYLILTILAEDKLKISIIVCIGAAAFALWAYYKEKIE